MIVLHDGLPPDLHMARRDLKDMTYQTAATHEGWWTGDVWKVPLILRALRPDPHILCIDAQPTGLVMISNLDPESRVLSERLCD